MRQKRIPVRTVRDISPEFLIGPKIHPKFKGLNKFSPPASSLAVASLHARFYMPFKFTILSACRHDCDRTWTTSSEPHIVDVYDDHDDRGGIGEEN